MTNPYNPPESELAHKSNPESQQKQRHGYLVVLQYVVVIILNCNKINILIN
ncbi:hypothetical protein [Candidatus Parabeggiatoa sp. HSG14]|uniref:hypothetical protein n=1 Tax=Candidatus Parabeggiatoa sp. HSG14 TaxID=3055593 RepID=UPI0025A9183F|nr:hypothetical protein [Thiotrichales bacterium HSG14]